MFILWTWCEVAIWLPIWQGKIQENQYTCEEDNSFRKVFLLLVNRGLWEQDKTPLTIFVKVDKIPHVLEYLLLRTKFFSFSTNHITKSIAIILTMLSPFAVVTDNLPSVCIPFNNFNKHRSFHFFLSSGVLFLVLYLHYFDFVMKS